jgi:crotonobetainyl-CoA:carnitine CoA-transferase CaiB-like acyl-CoA transferase
VQITAISPSTFSALVRLTDQDDLLADPRLDTAVARAENQESVDQIIADWTRDQNLVALECTMIEAGVPAARIYRINGPLQRQACSREFRPGTKLAGGRISRSGGCP